MRQYYKEIKSYLSPTLKHIPIKIKWFLHLLLWRKLWMASIPNTDQIACEPNFYIVTAGNNGHRDYYHFET